MTINIQECTLKDVDPDRYLLSFFAGNNRYQSSIQIADELNYEISRLRDVIDTPHMGFIRLQWWRDEIGKLYAGKTASGHPVLIGLGRLIGDYKIPFQLFDALLSAREADFEEYDGGFDISRYGRSIHTPLLQIKACVVGESADVAPLAEAYALVGLIRAIPFFKARSQVILPDIQPDSVRQICDKAFALLSGDGTTHRYFRAHHVLARLYLRQLAACGYHPEKLYPLPFKELRLWWGTR